MTIILEINFTFFNLWASSTDILGVLGSSTYSFYFIDYSFPFSEMLISSYSYLIEEYASLSKSFFFFSDFSEGISLLVPSLITSFYWDG